MSDEMALLDCTFGWGKLCRLYEDSIEVAGKSYKLDHLTSIHPTYRKLFGVSSARLELSFGSQHLTLRGIPDSEIARQMVGYLLSHCSTQAVLECSRSAQARDLVRAQAKSWEPTHKLPAIPRSLQETLPDSASGVQAMSTLSRPVSQDLSASLLFESDDELLYTSSTTTLDASEQSTGILDASEQPTGILDTSEQLTTTLDESAEPAADTSERPTDPLAVCEPAESPPIAKAQPQPHIPRMEPPLHSVHLVNPEEKKVNSCSMPAVPACKSSVLPVIHVPVRLQPGECAHYSIGATLCSDRLSAAEHVPYPPVDHGLLILTNRRIFYMGKCSTLILPYAHLWYVSFLYTAIALHIEGQFRRIIIEVEHAQEWASRVDQLAFIARSAPTRPARLPLSTSTLRALKPSPGDSSTLKRSALKAPAEQKNADLASDAETQETQELDDFRTSALEAEETQEFDRFKTDALDAEDICELNEIETIMLNPGCELNEAETIMLNPEVSQPLEEVETSTLDGKTLPLQNDDEQTICLRERRKVHTQPIPRRIQARRGFSDAQGSDDTTIRPRRMPRGRIRKRL